ncbi:uncharacterized protein LOC131332864 [Rhododendron vialii]|uniref:uncharacterized protein LOC131332864 n=1 Tax=Rhododendron vialii TaxID=182163 RepID=UPI00265FBC15|nr:uncharacterized protein LOC131332864 [Rhododendron vialii]
MVEVNPTTPHDPKNLLDGGGNQSPPKALRKPEGRHRRTTSKGRPLTVHDNSKSREGKTASRSTRRSKSHHRDDSIAHSKSELERIREHLEDSGLSWRNSRGDEYTMVKYEKAPSRGKRSRSRSLTSRRRRVSLQKERSQTPERRRATSKRRRSRGRSSTPEKERTRKHHRDRYERPDSD